MKKIGLLVLLFYIAIVYRGWFLYGQIIGGDWPYFFRDFLKSLPPAVLSWNSYYGNGLGGQPIAYALDSYLYIISFVFVRLLSLPWEVVYKIFYFGTFLAVSIYSTYYFVHSVMARVSSWQWMVAAMMYCTNTYILMVTGGGQMGVALAYALVPLAVGCWIRLINEVLQDAAKRHIIKRAFTVAICVALVILFDARIAYIVGIVAFLYYAIFCWKRHSKYHWATAHLRCIFYGFFIPLTVACFFHAAWILPIIIYKVTPLDNLVYNFTSAAAFKFYSFATFSSALALLHPNWPENIFGKVYFLRPEYLALPIVAFSALLVIHQKRLLSGITRKNIIFFTLLGLIGIFLSKGANEPFGEINIWLYNHIPGFTLFRDPTKFYLFIILSYIVLIPIAIGHASHWLQEWNIVQPTGIKLKYSQILRALPCVLFVIFWTFTIHEAFTGTLKGTFTYRSVPYTYVQFADFIGSQKAFFRTLWVPRQQRFAYYSSEHPSVESVPLFGATSSAQVADTFGHDETADLLRALAIKYVVIPSDTYGEIFTSDRSYSDVAWLKTVNALDSVRWLSKKYAQDKLVVYEVSGAKEHFYLSPSEAQTGQDQKVSYTRINGSLYKVTFTIRAPATLIFSEKFSPYWQADDGVHTIRSDKTAYNLNSFFFKNPGTYSIDIYFNQEKIYNYAKLITLGTVLLVAFVLFK